MSISFTIKTPCPVAPSPTAFTQIAARLGGAVPEDYRDFLRQNGGIVGSPDGERLWYFKYFDPSGTVLDQIGRLRLIYSVGIGDSHARFDDVLSVYDNLIADDESYPRSLLPIGLTDSSVVLGMLLSGNVGEIRLCPNGLKYSAGSCYVAKSFSAFIAILHLEVP